ncbi:MULTISPECIES: ATP-binding protein [unclassified Brevundimonas]|uniref:ATP-binding protein n=1 Tax=unclassified Brevundimonas TaxID=2622653 RepID=UPI0025BD0E86|nr:MULTISPECIES: ATP-binding protein [unclassified Brevundimonas]
MASATATAKAKTDKPRRRFRFGGSRLGGFMLALNLLSLLILLGGALALNEWSRGLINARQESLTVQAELLANVLGELGITQGDPYPALDDRAAAFWLRDNFIPMGQRARLFDADGIQVSDSYSVSDAIPGEPLPPANPAGTPLAPEPDPALIEQALFKADAALASEVERALQGESQATIRRNEEGERVVSVSLPVRHVQQVLGVLTLEAGDVNETLAAQRRALMPFAFVALAVNLFASLVLHLFVARPVLRLSAAADQVRLQRARAISLPDLTARKDEVGGLARALESMTDTMSMRMDAIERFAADVSHEIKNPLTSIRSALETLPLVKTEEQRQRLTNLLQNDVRRLDRLITDISNASRLDAELSRDRPRSIDLAELLGDIVGVYENSMREGDIPVRLVNTAGNGTNVIGRDTPLGQVFRNLIDNARSFSPAGGEVRVFLEKDDSADFWRIRVEDDGPGIPPDNLETVFERFYTSRPKGTAFGTNSGLGLSIVRQIVKAHEGSVFAANRSEGEAVKGATFTVRLPNAARRS